MYKARIASRKSKKAAVPWTSQAESSIQSKAAFILYSCFVYIKFRIVEESVRGNGTEYRIAAGDTLTHSEGRRQKPPLIYCHFTSVAKFKNNVNIS